MNHICSLWLKVKRLCQIQGVYYFLSEQKLLLTETLEWYQRLLVDFSTKWRKKIASIMVTSTWFDFSLNILDSNSFIDLLFCVLSIVPPIWLSDSGVGVSGNDKTSTIPIFLWRAKKRMVPKRCWTFQLPSVYCLLL